MVGYAVGEMMKPLREDFEDVHVGERNVTRWRPNKMDQCYEVVTAWVHPK